MMRSALKTTFSCFSAFLALYLASYGGVRYYYSNESPNTSYIYFDSAKPIDKIIYHAYWPLLKIDGQLSGINSLYWEGDGDLVKSWE